MVLNFMGPQGYSEHPVKGVRIDLSKVPKESEKLRRYFASVDQKADGVYLGGSRSLAFVGIGKDLAEAEAIAEEAANAVRGPVFHRRDIGTAALLQQRISHMESLHSRADSKTA